MMRSSEDASTPQNGTPARPYIGGQAVLEGVMMRAPKSLAVVVRRRDGSLHIRERAMGEGRKGPKSWPFIRGVMSLVESVRLGSEALRFSVEQMEKDLELGEPPPRRRPGSAAMNALSGMVLRAITGAGLSIFALVTAADGEPVAAEPKKRGGAMGIMMLVVMLLLFALPQAGAEGINNLFNLGLDPQSPGFQLITGAMKLSIVVGYLLLIRRVKDIRRVFQYHGAEHKTISTYEANETLTVEHARAKTTLHPRCGTTFLIMVALVSVIVFTAVGQLFPKIDSGNRIVDNVVFFLMKLPFVPVIAAVTFELQRIFARYFTSGPLRVVLWPGFLVQKITTIEPDDDQLEVALASLRATLFRQEKGEAPSLTDDVRFPTYEALLEADKLRQPPPWKRAAPAPAPAA